MTIIAALNRQPRIISIYYLRDPRNSSVFYVGQSTNPTKRLKQHLENTKNSYLREWFDELREEDKLPILEIVETFESNYPQAKEREHIRKLIADGAPLLNMDSSTFKECQ